MVSVAVGGRIWIADATHCSPAPDAWTVRNAKRRRQVNRLLCLRRVLRRV
jgi:hypothetical protein